MDAKEIGKNLLAMRGDMSQQDLADKMDKKGHKWVKATVWNIEQGKRHLKLEEAKSLTEIFGSSLDAFFTTSEDLLVINHALEDKKIADRALQNAASNISTWMGCRWELLRSVSLMKEQQAKSSSPENFEKAIEECEQFLDWYTVREIAQLGYSEYARQIALLEDSHPLEDEEKLFNSGIISRGTTEKR